MSSNPPAPLNPTCRTTCTTQPQDDLPLRQWNDAITASLRARNPSAASGQEIRSTDLWVPEWFGWGAVGRVARGRQAGGGGNGGGNGAEDGRSQYARAMALHERTRSDPGPGTGGGVEVPVLGIPVMDELSDGEKERLEEAARVAFREEDKEREKEEKKKERRQRRGKSCDVA